MKDVELAEGLTTIGESAFRNLDQMEKLVIPGTVTTIGICAFYDCDGLQEIAIPDSVTSIGKAAFAYCGNVTNIQLPSQLEMIEEQAFRLSWDAQRYHHFGFRTVLRQLKMKRSVIYI